MCQTVAVFLPYQNKTNMEYWEFYGNGQDTDDNE